MQGVTVALARVSQVALSKFEHLSGLEQAGP